MRQQHRKGKQMEKGKIFDMEAYKNGAEVICDACGSVIEDTGIESRVIAKDKDGYDVAEQFFECQNCGKHYTVTVIDRKLLLMIQKRRQLLKQIKLHEQIKSREQTIKKLLEKNESMKRQQMERTTELKERYREECGNV